MILNNVKTDKSLLSSSFLFPSTIIAMPQRRRTNARTAWKSDARGKIAIRRTTATTSFVDPRRIRERKSSDHESAKVATDLSRKWKLSARTRYRCPYRDSRSETFFFETTPKSEAGSSKGIAIEPHRRWVKTTIIERFIDAGKKRNNRPATDILVLEKRAGVLKRRGVFFRRTRSGASVGSSGKRLVRAAQRSSKLAVIWTLASAYHNHFVSDTRARTASPLVPLSPRYS